MQCSTRETQRWEHYGHLNEGFDGFHWELCNDVHARLQTHRYSAEWLGRGGYR